MLQAVGKYIIVLPEKEAETTKSGLILAPTGETKPTQRGKIVSVPADSEEFEVGQTVVYALYAPMEVEDEEVKYSLIDTQDVLAIITE